MRDIAMFVALSDEPDAIAKGIAWAQKGVDVANDARQSRIGKGECESTYLLLLYHLGLMQKVSVFFFWWGGVYLLTALLYYFR